MSDASLKEVRGDEVDYVADAKTRALIGQLELSARHPEAAEPSLNDVHEGDVTYVLSMHPEDVKYDVVIADPPYNIGKDFGNNVDKVPLDVYLSWSRRWIGKCLDLLVAGGVVYVYGFPEILARIAVNYPVEGQRWLVWHYTNKAVPSSRFWQRSHESILCLWRPDEARPRLEVDQIRVPYSEQYMKCAGKRRAATESRFGGRRGRETVYRAHERGALPRDVITVPALAGGAGASERWFMCHDCGDEVFPPAELKRHREHRVLKHPTQKPMELTRRLIMSRVNGSGGRILVPFAGSGSECVVAQSLGVGYLGIDKNPQYVEFAKKWLKQAKRHV